MNAGNGATEVLVTLENTVCPDPDVKFVVAFGSQIEGEPTQSSDLDVAIKFVHDLTDRDRFEKRCFLSGTLQREDAPFVDLSDIEMLPLDVAHDAVNGTFVCGDEGAFEQFKMDIEAVFADQRDTLRRQQREVIDRIAEGGLRG